MTGNPAPEGKYILENLSCIYVGAACTFGEILENAEAPLRLRLALQKALMPDGGEEMALGDFFAALPYAGLLLATLKQLRIRVKLAYAREGAYKVEEWMAQKLDAAARQSGLPAQWQILEIIWDKWALMMF